MSLPEKPRMFWRYRIYPSSIVHIGAHRGTEADFYSKYCDGPVFWFEAVPKLHASLVQNISKFGNQHAYCAFLSDVDGADETMKITSNDGQSSSILDFGSHKTQHPDVRVIGKIPVKTVRLDTFLRTHNIGIPRGSFLTLDVQGVEDRVLRGLGDQIQKFDWIYCEVNRRMNGEDTYKGCPPVEELDAFLAPHGFERRETWWFSEKHSWGDCLMVRKI